MCNIFHKMKHYIKNIYTAFFCTGFLPKDYVPRIFTPFTVFKILTFFFFKS